MVDGTLLARAKRDCAYCHGTGMQAGQPCDCSYQGIFKHCAGFFEKCSKEPPTLDRVTRIDWCADFVMVSQRALRDPATDPDLTALKLFKWVYLLGAAHPLVMRKLGLPKATYFRFVKQVQVHLGKAYVHTSPNSPYGIYPIQGYLTQHRGPLDDVNEVEIEPLAA